jgi:hypothetical protein
VERDVPVRRSDLEETLDYLEGLVLVLRRLHAEGQGRHGSDELLDELMQLDGFGLLPWQPLRHQLGGGTGWDFVAANIEDLRARLIERYGNAAL